MLRHSLSTGVAAARNRGGRLEQDRIAAELAAEIANPCSMVLLTREHIVQRDKLGG